MADLKLKPEPVPLKKDSDGVFRVGRTRVTLDTLVEAFREGCTADAIAEQYPSLSLADVYAAITYYLRHTAEVERYLRARSALARKVRGENERRFPATGLRERLMSRRSRRS